jgi:hypothetical protein
MKGVAHRLQVVMLGGDMTNVDPFLASINQGKDAVVGSHKVVPLS